jgi:hypothetical protein
MCNDICRVQDEHDISLNFFNFFNNATLKNSPTVFLEVFSSVGSGAAEGVMRELPKHLKTDRGTKNQPLRSLSRSFPVNKRAVMSIHVVNRVL